MDGWHANSSEKDPFLNGLAVLDKTTVFAIFAGKNDLATFWLFYMQNWGFWMLFLASY